MLIGTISIVGRQVRIYDVDGSHIDLCMEDVVDLGYWLTMHHAEIRNILRTIEDEERKRVKTA